MVRPVTSTSLRPAPQLSVRRFQPTAPLHVHSKQLAAPTQGKRALTPLEYDEPRCAFASSSKATANALPRATMSRPLGAAGVSTVSKSIPRNEFSTANLQNSACHFQIEPILRGVLENVNYSLCRDQQMRGNPNFCWLENQCEKEYQLVDVVGAWRPVVVPGYTNTCRSITANSTILR